MLDAPGENLRATSVNAVERAYRSMGIPTQPIVINQRVILNYYTAKRLVAALHMSLERHEGAFGVLETDIQKRVQPAVRRQAASASS